MLIKDLDGQFFDTKYMAKIYVSSVRKWETKDQEKWMVRGLFIFPYGSPEDVTISKDYDSKEEAIYQIQKILRWEYLETDSPEIEDTKEPKTSEEPYNYTKKSK